MKREGRGFLVLVGLVAVAVAAYVYWPQSLTRVERQFVGDWVLVNRNAVQRVQLRADRRIYFPISTHEPISEWKVVRGQLVLTHRYRVTAFQLGLPLRHAESYAWEISGDSEQGFVHLKSLGPGQLPDAILIRCDHLQPIHQKSTH